MEMPNLIVKLTSVKMHLLKGKAKPLEVLLGPPRGSHLCFFVTTSNNIIRKKKKEVRRDRIIILLV